MSLLNLGQYAFESMKNSGPKLEEVTYP
jgi:hypothetical protein